MFQVYYFPKPLGPPPLALSHEVHTSFTQKTFNPNVNADSLVNILSVSCHTYCVRNYNKTTNDTGCCNYEQIKHWLSNNFRLYK